MTKRSSCASASVGRLAEAEEALDALIAGKPKRHGFDIAAAAPAVERHMSVTGG